MLQTSATVSPVANNWLLHHLSMKTQNALCLLEKSIIILLNISFSLAQILVQAGEFSVKIKQKSPYLSFSSEVIKNFSMEASVLKKIKRSSSFRLIFIHRKDLW